MTHSPIPQEVNSLGKRTEFTYDAVGNKVSQRDARFNTTRWDHDHLGRVIARTLPGAFNNTFLTESFAYDAAGNRTS